MPANLPQFPKPNPNITPMNLKTLKKFLPTVQGWVTRKVIQYTGTVSASVAAWLVGQGASEHQSTIIAAGVVAVVTSGLEIAFSRIAAKLEEK